MDEDPVTEVSAAQVSQAERVKRAENRRSAAARVSDHLVGRRIRLRTWTRRQVREPREVIGCFH